MFPDSTYGSAINSDKQCIFDYTKEEMDVFSSAAEPEIGVFPHPIYNEGAIGCKIYSF